MRQLAIVTIGQAPRNDVASVLMKYVGNDVHLKQAGALDGLSKAEVEKHFSPQKNEYILTTRLTSGAPVILGREKIKAALQKKIEELEKEGYTQILLLCTGVFHGLKTERAVLYEPDQIISPVVSALVRNRTLGLLVPLLEQQKLLAEKWSSYGIDPLCEVVSPYADSMDKFEKAGERLRQRGADIILLDCMGYDEEMRSAVRQGARLPVILSNALMAKLLSEMI